MKQVRITFFAITLILLASCAPQATPPPTLPAVTAAVTPGGQAVSIEQVTGVNWQWTQFQETQPPSQSAVPNSQNYTLTLTSDGNFTFGADCNSGSGTYTSNSSSLTLTPGPVTLAECGPESLSSNYIQLLGQVTAFGMQNGQLILTAGETPAYLGFSVPSQALPPADLMEPAPAPAIAPDPASVILDTQGIFSDYQAELVEPGDFDPGRAGLPEHTQVTFGDDSGPILYIVPVGQYEKMWDANEMPLVSSSLAKLEDLLMQKPSPFNTCCMPVLPVESAAGRNDLAAQGAYLPIKMGEGLRFVGRFRQDAGPVAKDQFYYVFQGLSSDGRYFISLFYPVSSTTLPDVSQIPQQEFDQAVQDPEAYLAQKAEELNALGPDAWSPSLTALDALIASLQFASSP